jgi:thiol:disulfide interchange protein
MARIDDRITIFEKKNQRSLPLWLAAAAVVLLIARISMSWSGKSAPEGDLVKWVPLEQAVAASASSGKPIMLDFTAAWCGPCHRLDEIVFRDAKLAAMINDRFIPVRVVDRKREDGRNSPEVDELQQRFSVNAFPTLVFADANGTARGRMQGFGGRAHFEQTVRDIR